MRSLAIGGSTDATLRQSSILTVFLASHLTQGNVDDPYVNLISLCSTSRYLELTITTDINSTNLRSKRSNLDSMHEYITLSPEKITQ